MPFTYFLAKGRRPMSSIVAESATPPLATCFVRLFLVTGTGGKYPPLLASALLLPLLLLLTLGFLYPVGRMLVGSLFNPGFTLENYIRIFTEPLYLKVLLRTLWIASATTIGAFVLGYPVAYAMARASGKLTLWMGACVLIPLWTSVLVRSYAWIILLQRKGVLNDILIGTGIIDEPLRMIYTEGAVIGKRSADNVRPKVPRHEHFDLGCRPSLSDAGQGLREPVERIDAVHFAGLQQGGYRRPGSSTALAAGE